MLAGIAAQKRGSGSGGVGLVDLDFVLQVYGVNGSEVSLSSVLDADPSWITANGLELTNAMTGGALANFDGTALAHILALNWTAVIEYEELSSSGATRIFWGNSSPIYSPEDVYLRLYRDSATLKLMYLLDGESGVDGREVHGAGTIGVGIHRVAITRTDDELWISVDGETPVEAGLGAYPLTGMTAASLGGDPDDGLYNDLYIRSFTLLAEQDSAALATLSTI